jgi:trimeric autotransporter adhesin
LTVLNGELYFFAHPFEGEGTAALWRSDATIAGTSLVTEITPGTNSDVSGATVLDGKLLFFRGTTWPVPGTLSLWTSDGTAEGTRPVANIGTFPSARPDFPGPTSRVGAIVFFVAAVAGSGTELWATDGTAAGTQLVRDINAGDGNSFPYDLSPVNGTLFFSADDGVHGRELWKTTPPVPLAPERSDYKNVSAYCKALRAFLGDSEFSQRYKNHGLCVSANKG